MNNAPFIDIEHALKKSIKYAPLFTVVEDHSTDHCAWFHKVVDKLFVAPDRVERLATRRFKVSDENIATSRLPMRRDFDAHDKDLGQNRSSSEAQKTSNHFVCTI